ncbi:PEP-CTERM sorting domain-containing protein [Coraliomargarita sp. SDUM461004]|uniref:PEP-CTERM sorting domain-containing protein n=1 Tax=Thalassobacterium sedimentorum TaxID=3041258 RepID=A0ABU1AIZ1_9BACT|nr:LamG-like jellyroll fold domain-containing protein [Coraliomargarita sp. SDUM461004]MDQ8194786.1 PEP-CTERM sorting domain-containing protein [Coraliomargarita sp. SDUM461004]
MKKIYTILTLNIAGFLLSAQAADPVLHYALDEGAGSTAANLGTATGANGALYHGSTSLVGAAGDGYWVADSPSGSGSSYSMTTPDSYVQAGVLSDLSGVGDFTFTMWLKLSDVQYNDRIFSTRGTAGTGFIDLLAVSGSTASALNLSLQLKGTGGSATINSVAFDATEWTFLSVVRDGDTVTFNTGSVLLGSAQLSTESGLYEGTVGQSAGNFEIAGTAASGSDRSPLGAISDFRFYNEALSLSAIDGVRQSAIPEPSTTMMLSVIGIIAVGLRRRGAK